MLDVFGTGAFFKQRRIGAGAPNEKFEEGLLHGNEFTVVE